MLKTLKNDTAIEYLCRAFLYEGLDRDEDAIKDLEVSIEKWPLKDEVLFIDVANGIYGKIYSKRKKYIDSIKCLRRSTYNLDAFENDLSLIEVEKLKKKIFLKDVSKW